jgi:Zn-dependent protease
MRWSLRLATVAGIPVYLHVTFLLFLVFVLVAGWTPERGLAGAVGRVLFVLVIFGAVVLHEFGHALTARRFGVRTRDITLLPIGGLARLERMPDAPIEELWVALAGPAVNFVLAGLGIGLAWLFSPAELAGGVMPDPRQGLTGNLRDFIGINLALALFNLIPAFPMDGGRALRALLATKLDYARATSIAASLGQAFALVLGFWGLLGNPVLVFIALFVWLGASAESSAVTLKSALEGVPVARAMMTDFRALDADDRLQRAADLIIAGSQQDFPVVQGGRLIGILTRDALMKAIASLGFGGLVSDAMTTNFGVVDAREMMDRALARLQESGGRVLPVLSGGQLVGLLTAENIGEFVMLRSAGITGSQGPKVLGS